MTDLYQCPTDGCDFEGPKQSVKAHYSGKPDDAHPGGYHDAKTLLEDADPIGTVGDGTEPDEDDHQPDDTTTDTTNPAMSSPDPQPRSSNTTTDDTPTCPSCNGQLVDVRDDDRVNAHGKVLDTSNVAYLCQGCGKGVRADE